MGKVLAVGDIHTKIWVIEKVAKVSDELRTASIDFDKQKLKTIMDFLAV